MKKREKRALNMYAHLTGDDRRFKRQEALKMNPYSSLFRVNRLPNPLPKPAPADAQRESLHNQSSTKNQTNYYVSCSSLLKNVNALNENALKVTNLSSTETIDNLQNILIAILNKEEYLRDTYKDFDLLCKELALSMEMGSASLEYAMALLEHCEDLKYYLEEQLYAFGKLDIDLLTDDDLDFDSLHTVLERLKEQLFVVSEKLKENKSDEQLLNEKKFLVNKIKECKEKLNAKRSSNEQMQRYERTIKLHIRAIYETLLEEKGISIHETFEQVLLEKKVMKKQESLQPLFSPLFAKILSQNNSASSPAATQESNSTDEDDVPLIITSPALSTNSLS